MDLHEIVVVCRMPLQGRGKGKAPASSFEVGEESRWHGMQEEFRSMMHEFMQSFGKGSSNRTKGDPWLKELSCLHAPAFNGKGKLEECEAWLLKIEKILESMECLEEKWVRLASFLLEGNANQWWRAIRR